MKKFKLIPFLAVLLFITACDNSDFSDLTTSPENIETYNLTIKYNGISYLVPCTLIEDKDTIIFNNCEFENIYKNEISNMRNVKCEIINDSTIIFSKYNTLAEEAEEQLTKDITNSKTRALGDATCASLHFWDDSNFHDRNYLIEITKTNPFWVWSNLKTFNNFNDKISALKIENDHYFYNGVIFKGYEHTNYQGDVLEYKVNAAYPVMENPVLLSIPKLKRIPKASGGNWNDKISSIKFYEASLSI